MSDPQFFQTRMGQRFYEGTMSRIATALEGIASEMAMERTERAAVGRQAPSLPPALAERQEAWHALIGEMVELLHDHENAWLDEEDSVKEEHAELITRTTECLKKLAGRTR